ncbi:hypothetical protein ABLE93_04665 [Xanthobacter sp. KR7-65]|uniref:hypothetical protein n=1 Tax=Xanthobacter sp. KR7-65 TaxID=3156612 RepID=UPI0032B48FAA
MARVMARIGGRHGPGACGLGLALLLAASPAAATGTLTCSIDDKRVAFEAQTAFSHGFGAGFNGFQARLELKGKDAPAGFAPLELNAEALVHHWFHGKDVRLHLFHAPSGGPDGEVELVLQARATGGEEDGYAGRYVLTVSAPGSDGKSRTLSFKGRATCSAG